jgi:ketosteroid isomerase-like protein
VPDVNALADRQAIADLCARYCYALDRNDWPAVAACFTDEPVFTHPGGRVDGAVGIVERARGALEQLDASQHLLGNVLVDLDPHDPDAATCISYFQAQHVRAAAPGGDTYLIAGSYTDRLTRTAAGWRIAHRDQVYLWRSGNRAVVQR